jgi:hypothetical protein
LPFHCTKIAWLGKDGEVLAVSDFEDREKFLTSVCRHRAVALGAHWEFLLEPMVPHHSGRSGAIRYRQLEYYRMPIMAFLALDDPAKLTRFDYAQLAFAAARGDGKSLPFSTRHLRRFETDYCYDRYFEQTHREGWCTRIMCSGHAFVITGDARSAFFIDPERGLLGQFRHQYFVLGLLVHFHKAALLMMSDRLVGAVKKLDITEAASIRRFRRDIRQTLEIFLRFTHRYWYHEISDQVFHVSSFRACPISPLAVPVRIATARTSSLRQPRVSCATKAAAATCSSSPRNTNAPPTPWRRRRHESC